MTITIKQTVPPTIDNSKEPIILSDVTYQERKNKILMLMKEFNFSSLLIYADKEHGSNFEYLTGFIPRFEEAIQVLNLDGSSTLILGNENANKVGISRVESKGIKCPVFSLPNQPQDKNKEFKDYLKEAKIDNSKNIGLVGWKLFSNVFEDFNQPFSMPSFIVESIKEEFGNKNVKNATQLYIHPKYGARITNNAEEILHYEYGASLASDGVLDALESLEIGQTELEAGNHLNKDGQYQTVVTIAAFGERFQGANLYPRSNQLKKGDKIALTVSYKGGLSSRSGYAVESKDELEKVDPGYLDDVVLPYFEAYKWWLENIKIGKNGDDFYQEFKKVYPQKKYGWELCPGHLVSDEEWMSSPFFENSDAQVKDGSIFQVDFIPSVTGHNGVSAESTIAIASETLREIIKKDYPDFWKRIQERRKYSEIHLGMQLAPEIIPLTSTLGYYTPYKLNNSYAIHFK